MISLKCKIRFIYVGFNCKRKIGVKKWEKKCLLRRPAPSQSKKCCPVHLCYAPCIMYNLHTTLTLRNWSSTSIHLSWRSTWYIRASNWPENTKNALRGWYYLDKFLWLEEGLYNTDLIGIGGNSHLFSNWIGSSLLFDKKGWS